MDKWLRPADGQFEIWWAHNSRRYNPDFVVETNDAIYMIETKMQKDIDSDEVKEKAKGAIHYCSNVSKFTLENGKKPWKYVLIPHEAVKVNMGFNALAKQYEYEGD